MLTYESSLILYIWFLFTKLAAETHEMKLNFIKYLILFLVFASCEKQIKKIKNYGIEKRQNDNLSVSLKISEFNNYGTLINRVHKIKCNDSLPKIIIEHSNLTRNIYPIEHCEPIMFHPKSK